MRENTNVIFEQYRLYVDSIEKLADRRQRTHHLYIILNSALMGGVGYLYGKDTGCGAGRVALLLLVTILGIGLCVIFNSLLEKFGQLSGTRLKLVGEIEKKPLFEKLYSRECDRSCSSFSAIEGWVPKLFLAVWILLLIFILCQVCGRCLT